MKRVYWTIALLLTLCAGRALAVGGLTEMTIYDRTERRALPVYWHEDKAYVVGRPGNEYQIMLRNKAGGDVLAVVSVDGVNVVSGETASAAQSGYVLDTWSNLDIKGWRKSLSRTAAFYFTELPDSYAARTGRPDNVGVIGVALFRRKAPEVQPYVPPAPFSGGYDEPRAERSAPAASADSAGRSAQAPTRAEEKEKSLGTGHGRNETSHARQVSFERATTNPEEVITLYYDSRANLVARGVISPEPWREPQPFPARFVLDPPRR